MVLKVSRNNRYGILHFTTIIKNINIEGKCNEKNGLDYTLDR